MGKRTREIRFKKPYQGFTVLKGGNLYVSTPTQESLKLLVKAGVAYPIVITGILPGTTATIFVSEATEGFFVTSLWKISELLKGKKASYATPRDRRNKTISPTTEEGDS